MRVQAAVVQMTFTASRDSNVEKGVRLIGEAAGRGAQIIALPELATSIYFPFEMDPKHFALAEPVPGPSTEAVSAAARQANAYVLFPLYEKVRDGELYNTAVLIGPTGVMIGKYRKMSIPLTKMKAITGIEKFYFRPGNLGFPVWQTDLGIRLGTVICFDRHFPEGPRCLGLAGCDLMFVPTATAAGGAYWQLELQAHAVANCMWVAGVNRVGQDLGGGPAQFYGRSFFSSPEGEIAARFEDQRDAVLLCTIDTAVNTAMREDWGFFRDRRPDAYGALVAP